MTYQKTGNPPGRPRKDGQAPKPKARPKPAKPETHPAPENAPVPPAPGFEGTEHLAQGELCKEHWPDGWPEGATGLGCAHSDGPGNVTSFSWTRRL